MSLAYVTYNFTFMKMFFRTRHDFWLCAVVCSFVIATAAYTPYFLRRCVVIWYALWCPRRQCHIVDFFFLHLIIVSVRTVSLRKCQMANQVTVCARSRAQWAWAEVNKKNELDYNSKFHDDAARSHDSHSSLRKLDFIISYFIKTFHFIFARLCCRDSAEFFCI